MQPTEDLCGEEGDDCRRDTDCCRGLMCIKEKGKKGVCEIPEDPFPTLRWVDYR